MRLNVRSVCVLGAVLGSLLNASDAAAYCQTTTSEQQVSSCSPTCVTDGYPLAWPDSDITYVFNEKGFPGLTDGQMRDIFADAFGAWESVDCDGKPVGLNLTAAKGTTTLTVGPENDEPNASVIAHLGPSEWAGLDLDSRAFALTAIWFDANSGRILGADMHFNGGMDPFGVCPDAGCTSSMAMTDLPNVATHEAGHFLGLAHSQDQQSTMWCDAQGNETNKRSLADDDARGLCTVYPAGIAFTDDYFPTPSPGSGGSSSSGGCAAAPITSRPYAFLWSCMIGLGLLLRRRRG